MSDTHATPETPAETPAEPHHAPDELGPADLRMWAVGVVGVLAALIITAGFVAATGFQFNA